MIHEFMTSLRDTDHKIIVLPIVCLLLWVWHLLGNMLYVHIGMDSNNSLADIIMLLSVSVCVLSVCVLCMCVYECMSIHVCMLCACVCLYVCMRSMSVYSLC